MGQIGKGLQYLKSIPAILKLIEFVILLIAIGTVGYFLDNTSGSYKKKGSLQFFMFVVVVGWILVIALFTLFVTGLHEKITAMNWPLGVAILSALWAVLLLISSALVADVAAYYDKDTFYGRVRVSYSFCDFLKDSKADPRCGQLVGGAVCGFIAMILHAIDTFVHFRMYMTKSDAPQANPTAVSS